MLDFHSHILPGLDDGAPDMKTALEMARIAVEDGITEMVATPHYIEGSVENSRTKILKAVADFQEVLNFKGIYLKLIPGAEIYFSPRTPELLEKGLLLTINDGHKYLLIEFPMHDIPRYTDDVIFELQLQGITPIIAHPERNLEFAKKPERILHLISKGCLIQVNSGSITGLYGTKVKFASKVIVKNNLVHLVGSDAHSAHSRTPKVRHAFDVIEKQMPGISQVIMDYSAGVISGVKIAPGITTEFITIKIGLWSKIGDVFFKQSHKY